MGETVNAAADTVVRKKEVHFLRVLCAIILLFITYTHYYVPYEYNDIIFGVGRFAIPVFFMISGYFSYSKDGHSEKSLGRKTLHILYLLIFLKVLYLVLDVIYYSAGVIDLDYLINSFFLWTDSTSHAWFLYSLVLVYVFWWLLYRYKVDFQKTYPLVFIILFLDILFAEILPMMGVGYIGDVTTVKIGETIYPFIGLPFFIIGYYLHRNKEKVDAKLSAKTLGVLIIIGVLLSLPETLAVPTSNLYIGSIILGISAFLICFWVPEDRLRSKFFEFMGRSLMPWLYVFYPGVIFFLKNVALKPWADIEWFYYGLGPFIAVAMNIVLAYLMYLLLKKVKGNKKKHRENTPSAA